MIESKTLHRKETYEITGIKLYLFVLFILLCEGSVFFGIMYGNVFNLIVFVFSLILAFTKKKVSKYNFHLSFVLIIIFIFNNYINIKNGVNWIHVTIFIMKLVSISIILTYIDRKKFITAIIKSMFFISLISLTTYFLRIINFKFLKMFEINRLIGDKIYIFTPWQTFGWNVDFGRNAGPYWEPGLFSCYIIIVLMLLIFSEEHLIKSIKKKNYSLVFLITLISAASTTGYIIMSVIITIWFCLMPIKNYGQIIKKIILVFVIITSVILLINSSVVQEKLFTENNSRNKRIEDFESGLKIVKESPIFGLGFKSTLSKIMEISHGNGGTSNGFIQGFYRMGSVLFIIFLILYLKGSILIMKNKLFGYSFWIITIILMFTEPIQINSIFLILLFNNYKYENKKYNSFTKAIE